MTDTARHIFPKAEKLKSRKQIDLLFREGKSFFAAPVKCYFRFEVSGLNVDELDSDVKSERANVKSDAIAYPRIPNPRPETSNLKPETSNPKPETINIKAGVSVSKRNFKHSGDRNRIKRLLREAYRLHKHTLLDKLAEQKVTLEVFFVFTDRSLPTFALVEEKMKYCIRRLGKIAEGGS